MERKDRERAVKLWKRLWEAWERRWKHFPPGYEYEMERNTAGLLLGIAAALSLQYFARLKDAYEMLYYVDSSCERKVRPEAVAASFGQLAFPYGSLFLPYFLFLAIMIAYHYFYYYRDTKSIYLMCRLPSRSVLVKSCAQAPLLGMAAGALSMAVLCFFYYGLYLLVMPGECMPRFL